MHTCSAGWFSLFAGNSCTHYYFSLLFDLIGRSIALELDRFRLQLVSQAFVVVFIYNRLVFGEVLFILLVKSIRPLICCNLTRNTYDFLALPYKQGSCGPALGTREVSGFGVGVLSMLLATPMTVVSKLGIANPSAISLSEVPVVFRTTEQKLGPAASQQLVLQRAV